ncbi:DeoR/GlpR family DNA-binding transcription regulator [Pendulispora rubella]|uniref:DeoR/GlpR family DNA-binding transcription regulator n=1 Tax=Pendulispora rubella TaxID=2741070 RepID=A0ABZ2KVQ5_9BACT
MNRRYFTAAQMERHTRLLELLEQRGEVSIDDLAQVFGVSAMTIHRDLDLLEERGRLQKVRGGAIRPGEESPVALDHEQTWQSRLTTARSAKLAIARAAAAEVRDGMTVFMDDSTSCVPLVPHIAKRSGITVVTNALSLVPLLTREGLAVVMIGGTHRPEFDANVGLLAHDAIGRMRFDVSFMSTPAVHDGACYHPDQDSVLVKRAALAVGRVKILLADHSKFAHIAPYQFAKLADFTRLFTDSATSHEAYVPYLSAEQWTAV